MLMGDFLTLSLCCELYVMLWPYSEKKCFLQANLKLVAMAMTMPNKAPFAAFKIAVMAIAFFDFLAWLLVLGGVSALEHVCPYNCRYNYGLAWFIIW